MFVKFSYWNQLFSGSLHVSVIQSVLSLLIENNYSADYYLYHQT